VISTEFKDWKWKKVSNRPKTWELGCYDGEMCIEVFGRVVKNKLKLEWNWEWFADVRMGPVVTGDPERFRDSAMELVNEQLGVFLEKAARQDKLGLLEWF
jgi:hypothetical protein